MAYSPIAFTAPNYRDYEHNWVKAYEPGTTTPKPLALEPDGGTQVAKLEINKDGFLISAGAALVIPYIDGAYDLWMFPTEAEADANDTVNALRIADDITGVNGDILANLMVKKFNSLEGEPESAVNSEDIKEGDVLNIKERTIGNGGGAMWDAVLASSVTIREDDIVACIGVPTLSLVRRNKGTNEDFLTTEQLTKYTMTPNRHIFGEEYLWGLHKNILDSANTNLIQTIWSGDSTTAGDNAGAYPPSALGAAFSQTFGVFSADNVNAGHSGDSATDWNSTWVDQDIANYPNMDVYVTRWGINHPAQSITTTIAAIDSGIAKLRAFKSVEALTIILMAPNSTFDDPNNRGTDWYEQLVPELRKLARKYQTVFFDTYSIWQDARQGALNTGDTGTGKLWLDNPFGDGRGIHPDAAFNHQIIYRVCAMMYEPITANSALSTVSSINVNSADFIPSVNVLPSNYNKGKSCFRATVAEGWPVDGAAWTEKSSDNIAIQTLVEFSNTTAQNVLWRVGTPQDDSWSDWRSEGYANVTYNTGWSAAPGSESLKLSTSGKTRTLHGSASNTGNATNGAIIATLALDESPVNVVQGVFKTQTGSTFGIGYFTLSQSGNITISADGGDGVSLYFNATWVV